MRPSISRWKLLLLTPFPNLIGAGSMDIHSGHDNKDGNYAWLGYIIFHTEVGLAALTTERPVCEWERPMTKSTWHNLQSKSQACPDRWIALYSFHHGASTDLECMSMEIQNFLTAHNISASTTIHKITDSCIHCHSISHSISAYQVSCYLSCFMVKGLEYLAHIHKFTGATMCFNNWNQLLEHVLRWISIVLVIGPSQGYGVVLIVPCMSSGRS